MLEPPGLIPPSKAHFYVLAHALSLLLPRKSRDVFKSREVQSSETN